MVPPSGTMGKNNTPNHKKTAGSLQQLVKQLPQHSRKLLAEGMLLSKLSYLIAQWGGATTNLLTSAQRLQSKIGRWVTGDSKRTRIITILENCGWLSIREMAKYHSLVQLWKLVRLNKPSTMSEKIHLENENLVRTNTPRLMFTSDGFRCRTTNSWNQLSGNIRSTLREG